MQDHDVGASERSAGAERGGADVGREEQLEKQQEHAAAEESQNTSSSPSLDDEAKSATQKRTIWRRLYDTIYWCPPHLRWNPDKPPTFSMGLNILFGFAGAFTVANLYYNHPILNILADDFGVPYEKVSEIPTLAQAGYAAGLLFLCPLGDMLERRPFVLTLVFFTATMSIGLATTNSIAAFSVIQCITGVSTVTPQLMLPLVGDLAPPKRRAAAMSIVVSGLMLGILIARLLSGIMTQWVSWRYVYWMSVALQYIIFVGLWLFMPDYPATNKSGMAYPKILWSILVMLTKHPVLVQACLISFFTSATFTNFWTVLTFLLADEPYNYDPVTIGLFALVGIGAMLLGPPYARLVIDRFVPIFSVILGLLYCLIGVTIGTYTGTFTVAGPIIQAFVNDFGMQTAQIANRSAIFAVEPQGRNRVNTAFMVATFCGQLVGTSVGANLYSEGGWIASGSYSMGSIGMALLFTFARGPWEEGWFGWHGGWRIKKQSRESADGKGGEQQSGEKKAGDKDEAQPQDGNEDLEKGEFRHHDQHEHHHATDNQEAVSKTDAEKALEMRAAQDGDTANDAESDRSKKTDDILPAPPQGSPVPPQDTQA